MRAKTAIKPFFLPMVILAVAGAAAAPPAAGKDSSLINKPLLSSKSAHSKAVTVYYFHKSIRCPTCLLIEELTRIAYNEIAASDRTRGSITLKIINTDVAGNEDYERLFPIGAPQGVVVAEGEEGTKPVRWKNCEKIWDLTDTIDSLQHYIRTEIESFLQ